MSFRHGGHNGYTELYHAKRLDLKNKILVLASTIEQSNLNSEKDIEKLKEKIYLVRRAMKGTDFWFRYLEPISHKKINGPLPVEWETEVFEKFEQPYKRDGAGLTLAYQYLEEENPQKEELSDLIKQAVQAMEVYEADSIVVHIKEFHHFFLCNRLFLLNLAAIYTTGFECPDTEKIIPELRLMLNEVSEIYTSFNQSFSETPLDEKYLNLYKNMTAFVNAQPEDYEKFDHFVFIKDFVNPLFTLNQGLIRKHKVVTKSNMDYSLNKNATSIFSKNLYTGQNTKGIFSRVADKEVLSEIERIGKLLFYDPILSGNNLRACASCHKTGEYFTDTVLTTSFHFDKKQFLPRNTPSLINASYNHLLMWDGKHYTLQAQAKDVMTNPNEMNCDEKELVKKVLSCEEYKTAFRKFLKFTPQEKEVGMEHIASALTMYYSKFSRYYAPFDKAMNNQEMLDNSAIRGFNVFMSKAQCATCHFVPQFNGVKPPYVGSEFEVLGTPKDTAVSALSEDKGRYTVNPAKETLRAFRTGTIRNAEKTKPYMHNGIFTSLNQVIDFYDAGGGQGRGLALDNQTLESDSLHLSVDEKKSLLAFIHSLNEEIMFELPPTELPKSKNKTLNNRKVGGEY